MKKIYIVFVREEDGKFHAYPETIRTGQNLNYYIERYRAKISHICETRTDAEFIANFWNECYKKNNANLY